MPNPIDSYRIGGNGLVHFYAGNHPVVSAHVDSPAVSAKIRDIDAARGGAPPVADLDAAYRRSEHDTGPAHGPPAPRPPMDLGALDAAYARQQVDTGPRFPPPGPPPGPMPAMPPPGAMPTGAAMSPAERAMFEQRALQPTGGGPPMPPPGPPGAMPMGTAPPMSALDEAYRRQMADTGSRFGGR